jgi:hypothetical protein
MAADVPEKREAVVMPTRPGPEPPTRPGNPDEVQ